MIAVDEVVAWKVVVVSSGSKDHEKGDKLCCS